MENASKALLIAGAILIVIILISIGVAIVQSSQGMIQEADQMTTDQETTTFNNRFSTYQGTQKGATVQSLLSTVSANNADNKSAGRKITVILITADGDPGTELINSTDLTKASADIVTSARYKVVMSNTNADGYIDEITITKQ